MKIKNPSLELNWLKFPKDISIPDIIIISVDEYDFAGGYYSPNKYSEIYVDGREYTMERGILLIREDQNEATISHEFRHHQQMIDFGWKLDEYDYEFNTDNEYKDAIIDYYTDNIPELDALLYEVKHSPDETNLEEYEWVIKHNEKRIL